MRVSHFRIGDPRSRSEKPRALRIYATRYPPRGVAVQERERFGKFDVWFPFLAPSVRLLYAAKRWDFRDPHFRKLFFDRYERELLGNAEKRGAIDLLSALSKRVPVSLGCYCENPQHCHRSKLAKIVRNRKQL